MKKVVVFTSTRADYGILRPLIMLMKQRKDIQYGLLVSGTHLVHSFGHTVGEIELDDVVIWEKVEMLVNSDSAFGTLKSSALAILGYGEALSRIQPDVAVVLGDRYEAFSFGFAATMLGIPLAHLHGGEITEGALDDTYRHCLTKMARLHFVSTEDYRRNVIQMGEDPHTVFNYGALGLDNIRNMALMKKDELVKELGLSFNLPLVVFTFHPETATGRNASDDVRQLLETTLKVPVNIVITYANADHGGLDINRTIDLISVRNPGRVYAFKSLGSLRYFSIVRFSTVVVGNSSSGIIEVPSLGVPTINIGSRQRGRISGPSVFHCEIDEYENILTKLIEERPTFQPNLNPYGDGVAAEKIMARIIEMMNIQMAPKKFYNLEDV